MVTTKFGIIGSPAVVAQYFDVISAVPSAMVTDAAVIGRSAWPQPATEATLTHLAPEVMLDTATADIVVVGAGARNFELATRTLDRGHHVIVAAPWQLSMPQLTTLLELARSGERRLFFSQPAIWSGDVVMASRAVILKGERPGSVRGTLVVSESPDLADLIEQAMALSRLLIGELPETVSAAGGLHQAALHLFYREGRTAQFQLSAGEPRRERTVTLIADGRSWRLDLDQPRRLALDDTAGRLVSLRHIDVSPLRTPIGLEIVHLVRAFLNDEAPILSPEVVCHVVVGAEAVRRSLLGFGAPVHPASLLQAVEETPARPKLRAIAGGRVGSPTPIRPPLRIVS